MTWKGSVPELRQVRRYNKPSLRARTRPEALSNPGWTNSRHCLLNMAPSHLHPLPSPTPASWRQTNDMLKVLLEEPTSGPCHGRCLRQSWCRCRCGKCMYSVLSLVRHKGVRQRSIDPNNFQLYITPMSPPKPVRSTGLSHEESFMPKPCPHCQSAHVIYCNYGKRIGGSVGTVAGAFSGAATTTASGAVAGARAGMAAGPTGTALGAITGALAGCIAGLRLGKLVDEQLLCHFRCLDCRAHF